MKKILSSLLLVSLFCLFCPAASLAADEKPINWSRVGVNPYIKEGVPTKESLKKLTEKDSIF